MSQKKLDLSKIIRYALRLDASTIKRLGWVLDNLGIMGLRKLQSYPIKGYRKLDATGLNKGTYNKKWMIQENL